MAKVFAAAYRGKLAKLTRLLEDEDDTLLDCPSVDYTDASGTTALHAACQEGHTDCVELLVQAGAMVDAMNAGGVTPLISACENGHMSCVQSLLAAKAKVDIADKDNETTALHGACQAGAADCVEALLEAKAPIDATDKAGATPLIIAAYGGHAECVARLLAAGADDTHEYDDSTALELAEQGGHDECARLLRGAADAAGGASRPDSPPPDANRATEAPARGVLSDLKKTLEQSGMGGAELIAEEEKKLEAQEKAYKRSVKEAEKQKKAEEAEAERRRQRSAAQLKTEANALFSAGKVKEAAAMYEAALERAEEELYDAEGNEIDEIATGSAEPPTRAVLYCNLAACRLRQRRWQDAIDACDNACDVHHYYSKALFRRAQARRALREFDDAVADAAAAHDAVCRAGGGVPVGEAGRKMAAEIEKFAASVKEEAEANEKAARRQEAEEMGITLGHVDSSESDGPVYYHYATQGDRTQDFMWWFRAELRNTFNNIQFERNEPFVASNGYPVERGVVRVIDFDPDPDNGDASRGTLEGDCTIRIAQGRRALFFDLRLEVPWEGVANPGTEQEQRLRGKTQIWNVNHFNELSEWQHLNQRNAGPNDGGPAMDAIAEQLAPAICANLKVVLQETIGMLLYNRIDPAMLEPPKKPPKPKSASRAWGKGTVDYSKWDNLSDDEEDEDAAPDQRPDGDVYQR